MAVDTYLKIDGICGESTDSEHKDWMEVLFCDVGVVQPVTRSASASGGISTGRADFQDMVITKYIDKASPKLMEYSAAGNTIKEISLALCRASGGSRVRYLEYKLSNCIISSHYVVNDQGSLAVERMSINFGKIEMVYNQQKRADGSVAGKVATAWDLETNKRC